MSNKQIWQTKKLPQDIEVSVIIVAYNNEEWVEGCLDALMAQTHKNLETIFVDNGSKDKSLELAKQEKYAPLNIKFVELDHNTGFSIGNNKGAEVATGEILFLLNIDTIIDPRVIRDAVRYFHKHPKTGVLQNKMLQLDNPKEFDSTGSMFTKTGFLRHLTAEKKTDKEKSYPIFSGKGASLFINAEFLKQTYLFSEYFHSYFEDTDLSWRAWLLGWKVVYLGKGTTLHKGGATSIFLHSGFTDYHSFKNRFFCLLSYLQIKSLIVTMPIHLMICWFVIFAYMAKFKFSKAWAILKAMFWTLFHLPAIYKHRKQYQQLRKVSDKEIQKQVGMKMGPKYAIQSLFGYLGRKNGQTKQTKETIEADKKNPETKSENQNFLKRQFSKVESKTITAIKSAKNKIQKSLKTAGNQFIAFSQKHDFWPITIILLLGLTPLLWYGPGEIALGHDMGFPLNPATWFATRLHTWNDSYAMGVDQSNYMASIILHGFEALTYRLFDNNVFVAQKLTYIVWFTLPGIAMYAFLRKLINWQKDNRYISLVGSVIYMFNLFILQGWFIAERNKFAILISLPLTMLVFLKVYRDKYSITKGAILISFIYLLLNGGGSLPLYGSTLIIYPLAASFFTYFYSGNKEGIKRSLKFIFLSITFFCLINAFWVLPQMFILRSNFGTGVENAGGVEGVKAWVKEISHNSSYVNLLRLEGLPDWSQQHHYAPTYLNNPLFILMSFSLFMISLYGVIRANKKAHKRTNILFLLILIFGTVFTAGSAGFLGDWYLWMVEHVPLFVVFRTPYYKFGGALLFAFAYLFPIGIDRLINDIKNLINIKYQSTYLTFARINLILLMIIYIFPFITGSFFDWNKPVSTMVKVPDYVFEYGRYVNSHDETGHTGRTLIVPPIDDNTKIDVTDWNYFSLDHVPSLVTNKPHITKNVQSSYSKNTGVVLDLLYDKLYEGSNPNLINTLFDILGVDSILLRYDAIDFKNIDIQEPNDWASVLNKNSLVRKERTFGKWTLYEINGRKDFYNNNKNIQLINAETDDLEDIYNLYRMDYQQFANLFEDPDNLETIKTLHEKNVITSELLKLNAENGSINNGQISYKIDPGFKNYQLYSKSLDITELWYGLNIKRVGNNFTLQIQRPQTEFTFDKTKLKAKPRSQNFQFTNNGSINRLVINNNVIKVNGNLADKLEYLDHVQFDSSQLSLSFGNTKDIKYANTALFDPSFESTRWEGLQICGGVISSRNIEINKTTDHTDGDFAAQITSRGPTTVCLIQEMKNLNKNKIYRLSFDYKNKAGYPMRYCVLNRFSDGEKVEDRGCLKEAVLDKSKNWKNYSVEFMPGEADQHILHFYTEGENHNESTNLVDNVRVYEIPTTSIGSFRLDTGIEGSQIFNIPPQTFENIGGIDLDGAKTIGTFTRGGNITSSYIKDEGFETTLWDGVNFCGGDPDTAYVNLSKSTDHTEGKTSAKLEAKDGIACIYTPIQNFRPSLTYKISFDYKNISGNPAQFCSLVRTKTDAKCQILVDLPKSKNWKTYSVVINTNKDAVGILPHLYSPASNNEESINLFDNVKLQVVYNPYEAIYLLSELPDVDSTANIKYEIKKQSASLYKLNIENISKPTVININTTYSPLWHISKQNGSKKPDFDTFMAIITTFVKGKSNNEIPHFANVGVENSWLISEKGEYEIVYLPDVIFYIGTGITFCYGIWVIIYLSKLYFISRKNKK